MVNKTVMLSFMMLVVSPLFAESEYRSQMIFPLQDKHVHGSSIVELPNGDLLAAWFHGSGERKANDVKILGSRMKKGETEWSGVFLMADTPHLPDCNPVLFLDRNNSLWMFWVAVRANRWEYSVLKYKTTLDYEGDGAPKWDWQDVIIPIPGEKFVDEVERAFEELAPPEPMWAEYAHPYSRMLQEAARDKEKRQQGWMTRIHPLQLESGRILLPVYSDGFNFSMAMISVDDGATWQTSKPIVGLAGIQPTFVQKDNGDIVAYMRETGPPPSRVQMSVSNDLGESWSVMEETDIPNPSSSLEVIALDDGKHWAMIYNDTEHDRGSMAVALSDDEGESWKWKRHIGTEHYYAYPSMIQSRDGNIHITYTYQDKAGTGKTIKHDVMNVEWIKDYCH